MHKILIVDDEEVIRMLYGEELEDEGYNVITTGSGRGLVELVERERPDLIILDIKMAEHDGLDLLQDIRKEFYNIPVILCSAYSSYKGDLKSIAADYYVVKSADLSELKQKIKMALEGHVPFQSTQE
jgi:DNA-binding response OmpR family regulator